MINDIEFRWKLGRASKGGSSIPKKLQYRVQKSRRVQDGDYGFIGYSHDELYWDEWRDVPNAK